ncbi:carboxypeptidase-like regulatory domain-containing protein [Hymenobacter algoricola]|uniref:Carboxypeptidase-like regulatory domain-containing protein n=1 Tax=Hymenobacter algoricola TaxID=486267 RepID=A0ABP7N6I3_9BACT
MRQPAVTLQIPSPCAEPWQAMTPQGAGRHCASCQKVVIDFARKSDAEILAILSKSASGTTCGRFTATQLNRTLRQPEVGRAGWWSTAVAATVALLLGRSGAAPEARAQAPAKQHPSFGRHSPEPEFWQAARPALVAVVPGAPTEAVVADTAMPAQVHGQVVDQQTGEGVPGVTVLLQGTTHGVSTGADGRFQLPVLLADKHRSIQVTSIGYLTTVVSQPLTNQPLRVVLATDNRMLGEVVVSGGIFYSPIYTPRGLWSRVRSIPYRVAYLFR